jgi:hypothetical protein
VNIIGAHRFRTVLRRTRDCVEIGRLQKPLARAAGG